jgi:TonB family protein
MIKNFSVPNPCHEKWDGMQPQENGRYCGSCQKVVIDFTNKTEQEIIDYIQANTGKKMCGTFKTIQLDRPTGFIEFRKNENTIRFLAALLLVFGMSLFSCSDGSIKSINFGDTIKSAPEQPYENQRLPGIIVAPTQVEKKICTTTTGDISIDTNKVGATAKFNHDTIVGMIAEEMPEFIGGTAAMMEYIHTNLKYPNAAQEQNIEGTVYINFIVKKDGSIAKVRVLRGFNTLCDNEAMRVIMNMPKWKPAKNHGITLDIQYNIPIRFRLK